ncbi:hypothetical protein DFH07DRAFT_740527 [Mycena maculata]|uniref:Uncharacterized protein n=1 Tax=Mycena maculata TaxID=230809 RepID=A0AAD7JAL3_9AGAR|nr:hypothetical protein DFH07DRAFT_740527 [Mycena maculata]
METPSGTHAFSSLAGGITDPAQSQTQPTQQSPPADAPTTETIAPVEDAPAPDAPAPPAKRPVGRPKGSKNKPPPQTNLDDAPLGKRPLGRPRGSGKKQKEEPATVQPKRPVGRPRKDGLLPGAAKTTLSALVPGSQVRLYYILDQSYYRMTSNAPVQKWSISAPPAHTTVVDPALERNEWADSAFSNPDGFLHALLAALDPPNLATLIGPSVDEAFKAHLGSLAPPPNSSSPSSANGASAPTQTIPSLYSILKTFWLPSSPGYFALTASTSTRTSGPHRFLYWDPQPLVFNGIACPACASPLTNHGRIRSGPLTVHDISGPFFIIGCSYVCANEHAYASTDTSVRRALPAALESEFPAHLVAGDAGVGSDVWNWQARGVSRALWNLVLGSLRAGLEREVILQLVRDVQHGVPPMGMKQEERTGTPMEEEESAEEAAHGQADVAMPPSDTPVQPATPSAAQAFNNAWTANPVVATAGVSPAPVGDLRNNPYASLAMAIFPQATMMPYDAGQRKRAYPFDDEMNGGFPIASTSAAPPAAAETNGTTKHRSPRHCCKCGSAACKGKGGRTFCTNPCQDCNKFTCPGRTSRRADRKCDSATEAEAQRLQGAQVPPAAPVPPGPQGAEGVL